MTEKKADEIPNAFIWRRLHSLLGLALVLFLIEHLLTNSQAALMIGDDGAGFIKSVNWIHGLPFLPAIEVGMLLIPFSIHILWGIKYLRTSKPNSWWGSGANPTLTSYPRNHAYTWQRLTSWFLIIAVGWHVWEMRFEQQPAKAKVKGEKIFVQKVSLDDGLYTVARRLDVKLFDADAIAGEEKRIALELLRSEDAPAPLLASLGETRFDPSRGEALIKEARKGEEHGWLEALKHKSLSEGEVMAVTPDFGTAILLMLRDTMKSPLTCIAYSLLVFAGVYHGFNGIWTWLITWGITLTPNSQLHAKRFSRALMLLFTALGLSAVWLTYFVNLRQ